MLAQHCGFRCALCPMEVQQLWHKHRIPATSALKWSLPTFDIFMCLHDNDLLVSTTYHEEAQEDDALPGPREVAEPESAGWTRWAFREVRDYACFSPALPDRPVVVRPRFPLNIPVGEQVMLYVSMPVWVSVSIATGNDMESAVKINSYPCLILSDTWFGDQMSGEFCYALKSRARRQLEQLGHRVDRAIVPVSVANHSNAVISLQKVCLRTVHLPLFMAGSGLWTGSLQIHYEGKDANEKITYGTTAPSEAGPADMITAAARKPESSNLLRRSLGF